MEEFLPPQRGILISNDTVDISRKRGTYLNELKLRKEDFAEGRLISGA
jgi:hypothetical protein